MPPTLITRDPREIRALPQGARRHHHQAALRQWRRRRLPHRRRRREPRRAARDVQPLSSASPMIVQRYLPEVRKGDKRIILVDGEPVGAINRVPAEGEARSNMHVGGRPEPTELTDARARDLRRDRPDAEGARPDLRRHRRDRRLSDRDQRHLADRHPRGEALRRRRHRRRSSGCDRDPPGGCLPQPFLISREEWHPAGGDGRQRPRPRRAM